MFITFEGGEGSGKTTQITRLAEILRGQGRNVVLTREPGGTPEAEKIRELLVRRDGGSWTPLAEVLLLSAARSQHVETVIRPALAARKVVLCDRFTDSTYAYQGYGHGVPLPVIAQIATATLGGFKPDLTLVFDLDPVEGLRRVAARTGNEDRFERLGLAFHERMRQGYLEIAANEPVRCKVIDAAQDAESVAEQVRKTVAGPLSPFSGGEG